MSERKIWQDVSINSQGISVVTFSQEGANDPVTEDETWFTWSELEAQRPENPQQ